MNDLIDSGLKLLALMEQFSIGGTVDGEELDAARWRFGAALADARDAMSDEAGSAHA